MHYVSLTMKAACTSRSVLECLVPSFFLFLLVRFHGNGDMFWGSHRCLGVYCWRKKQEQGGDKEEEGVAGRGGAGRLMMRDEVDSRPALGQALLAAFLVGSWSWNKPRWQSGTCCLPEAVALRSCRLWQVSKA